MEFLNTNIAAQEASLYPRVNSPKEEENTNNLPNIEEIGRVVKTLRKMRPKAQIIYSESY